ncbi:MAG: hypothetical protein AAGG01_02020 [Planctomycetota bacterium]
MPDASSEYEAPPTAPKGRPRWTTCWRLAWAITLLALLVRGGMIGVIGDATNFRVAEKNPRALIWEWGYEQGAIAESVREGRGFSDPFHKSSGPTGWAAPAYPALVAGLMEVTDGPSWHTALILAWLQALSAALVCIYLFRLGRTLHSNQLGLLAALAWALHPMAAYLPVALVWDSTFVALGLTWFLAHLAEAVHAPGGIARSDAAWLGARFGALLLINPAPLALMPVVLLYGFVREIPRRGVRDAALAFGAFVAVAALVSAPWTVRNAAVLGSPNVRTNLGVELFVGNNDGATGPFNGHLHPAYNADEFAEYVERGEVAYSAYCKDRAVAWAKAHPERFLRLTLERAQRFWIGPDPRAKIYLGMGSEHERDWQGWVKYAAHALAGALGILGVLFWRSPITGSSWIPRGTLLLFPLVYYLTHVFERYRFPIEPIVTLGAAAFVLRILKR